MKKPNREAKRRVVFFQLMLDYSILPEEDLIRLLKENDDKAFTEIYNRYWEKLLAIGYYYSKSKHVAEDMVHEVMMSLWKRRNQVDIKSLNEYLGTAIKFSVFKSIAKSRKDHHTPDILSAQAISEIEAKLDAKFLNAFLQQRVQELPEKARLVFTYSRADNLSITEIAGKMDLTPKAVEYHMTKAIKALKEALQKINSFFI